MKPVTTKKVTVSIAILMVIGIAIQLSATEVKNAPVTGEFKAPAEVTAIIKRACYDCHSNQTKLQWYDKIAPASWLVNADIKEARSRFNLSNWDSLSVADQQGKLWEMVNMVASGRMPLSTYTATHPSAKITSRDITVLKDYVNSISKPKPGDTIIVNTAKREFADFRLKHAETPAIPVAANGVKYITGYQNWQVISTTNRFDNNSIRIVYGNTIAVKAINENNIKVWPNGAIIVKAVWNSIEDKEGNIKPGTVNSIQIMTKDDKRFADTKGWGFAKFNGAKLVPYGATAIFAKTCYNCHKLADDNGYVFNVPRPKNELK